MMQKIRCANPNCRRLFVPNPRVKNHRYCGRKECRRLRKRRWQSEKMKTDPDYRKNQQESHQCWMEQNRDYYQRYRAKNPQYVTRNRLLQKLRDKKRRDRHDLAKMDESNPLYPVKPGRYHLIPAKSDLAKMDPISPQYFLIPDTSPFLAKKDSIDSLPFSTVECATKGAATHDGKSHPLSRSGP
jgi:hypothetical protein